ncbi:MAG: D-glycero-beta-D-manno-heptose 1-phosphate adenylyltransferase [Elusimicrobiaceae bacterium]|nr:D-glycero-beta-D-manno-heptose 1-phosphate adenylyltransferase [Elusimicrobiaceae bacterium]
MKAKNKIMTRAKLAAFVKKAKAQGKKIVFTNGCFDILHAGHVSSIEFAKSKGDILVIGLNSDASVKRLKGPKRPVNKQADRALVLAALGAVDAVCLFNQNTPLELIKLVKPDVLVKGADYKNKEVVGSQFAGRVVLFPLVKGRSTTNLINKMALQ